METPSRSRGAHQTRLPPLLGGDDLDRLQAGLQRPAHAHGRMRSLLDAVVAIGGTLELDVVLHTITESARRLIDARYAAIGVLGEDGRFSELITPDSAPTSSARSPVPSSRTAPDSWLSSSATPSRCGSTTCRRTPAPRASPKATP
ncbi:hypothetical protein [Streptomyces sp. NRRL S-813]|uniref:hypothetical protein n=1 Tax=Streptomyces sp. NRRL S-813 TaxID=1463919 RepID=UPI00068B6F01|nr:hypothetical protein [Streptomyces sp. NRRL S-813]